MIKDLLVEDIGINGEGIAKKNGKTFFIPNTLPTEVVDVEVKKESGNLCFCQVKNFQKISQKRQTPQCPYFEKCGGCNLQHLSYENTLKIKKDNLQRTLKKVGGINCEVANIIQSPKEFGYRNKIVIAILEKNGKTFVGLKEEDSHEIVEVQKCEVANKKLNDLLEITRDFIEENHINGYNEKTNSGDLKYVVGMTYCEQILITIVGNKYKNDIFVDFLEKINQKYANFGVFFNKIDNKTKNIFSNNFKHINGIECLKGEFFEIKYQISPYSFMQINEEIKQKIYTQVLEEIKENQVVIDAFSGAGLMSAMVSKKAKQVVGIEINKSATNDANVLAEKNNIKNLTNINGDCAEILPTLSQLKKEDLCVILDPPRSGCDKEVLHSVLEFTPNKIVYISCSPATLSRDLKILLGKYQITKLQPYDMFAWTKHLECLCVLKLK